MSIPSHYEFYQCPSYDLQVQLNTTSLSTMPIRIRGYSSAGDTLDACCTDQLVNLCDSRPLHPRDLSNSIAWAEEVVREAEAARLAEPAPEPKELVLDEVGGISDAQASLVRLDIGRPRRKQKRTTVPCTES